MHVAPDLSPLVRWTHGTSRRLNGLVKLMHLMHVRLRGLPAGRARASGIREVPAFPADPAPRRLCPPSVAKPGPARSSALPKEPSQRRRSVDTALPAQVAGRWTSRPVAVKAPRGAAGEATGPRPAGQSTPSRTDSTPVMPLRHEPPTTTPARRPVSRVLSRRLRSGDGHPSGTPVARRLERPTRGRSDALLPRPAEASPGMPSYLALLRVELARFTRPRRLSPPCRFVTVALVLASRRTGVTRYPASRSSDFPRAVNGLPRRGTRPSGRLAGTSESSGAPGTAPPSAQRPRRHHSA